MANNIIDTRKHYCVRRYPSEKSYYFHIIKCGKCGGNISARQQTQHDKLYITYRCNNACRGFCDCVGFSHMTMEKAFIDYLDTLKNMKPDESIMKKKKNILSSQKQKEEINKRIEKLESKKKTIRNQFINDLISVDEYRNMTKEIETQQKLQYNKISELDSIIEESKETYTYDDVKDLVTNIKLNWEHLTNKEKQQFLERFVSVIKVEKLKDDKIIINSVEFKRYL